jgi:hypothetical protein
MVAETQRWFVGLVRTRRGIDTTSVAGWSRAACSPAAMRWNHKLIDQIGGNPRS